MARKRDHQGGDGQTASIVRARHLVDDLSDALREGELGLKTVPGLMRTVLNEGAWKKRELKTGKVATFNKFADFITTAPLEGLGESPELIKRLLHDDAETLMMFETAMVGPAHRPKGGRSGDIVTTSERGNTKAYTLRRLSKDHPDLFEQVKAGELTANQAAIKAGFRKVKTPFEELKRWWVKADADAREAFQAFIAGRT